MFIKVFGLSLLVILSFASFAVASESVVNIDQQIRKNLKISLPDLVIDKILPTPIVGIYEVDSGRKVFYTDSSGKYLLLGNLLDLSSKTSLTQARVESLSQVNWRNLQINSAIVYEDHDAKELSMRSDLNIPSKSIAVFTDPDCAFCKRLEAETLSKLKGVRIYYYLFPLPIHPDASNKSKRILCAKDPSTALIDFMAKDKLLPKNMSCVNVKKLDQMMMVGKQVVQVTGTPVIVLPNGKIISGLIPADYLMRQIEENLPQNLITN